LLDIAIAAAVLALAVAVARRVRRDDGEDEAGGEGGGGNDRLPRPPDAPAGEPDWWPEFERAFAAHVAARSQGVGQD
jgi:hypothetical protein